MVRGCIRDESWECPLIKRDAGKKTIFCTLQILNKGYSYEGLLNCRECTFKFGDEKCKRYRKATKAKVINT